jgi:hypothetical protein
LKIENQNKPKTISRKGKSEQKQTFSKENQNIKTKHSAERKSEKKKHFPENNIFPSQNQPIPLSLSLSPFFVFKNALFDFS